MISFNSRKFFVVVLLITLNISFSEGLKVENYLLERNITPGETFEHQITISNPRSNEQANVKLGVFGYRQLMDGAIDPINIEKDTYEYSASKYISLSESDLILEPEWEEDVSIIVKVPKDFGDGSRYAVVKLEIPPEKKENITIKYGVLCRIILTNANSSLIKKGELLDSQIEWPNSTLIFQNNGNTHYRPKIIAIVEDSEGKVIDSISTNTTLPILPGYARMYPIFFNPKEPLNKGNYKISYSAYLEDGTLLDQDKRDFEVS